MEPTIKAISSDCEIVTIRTIAAPQHLVFRAWTEPAHLSQWWGPKGFSNTFETHDLRPGGKWKFIMHGPDKGNYSNECVFDQIKPPHLLSWHRLSKPLFRVEASFESLAADATRVTFRMIFDTKEACDKLRPYVPEKNEENMDRLEAELKNMTP